MPGCNGFSNEDSNLARAQTTSCNCEAISDGSKSRASSGYPLTSCCAAATCPNCPSIFLDPFHQTSMRYYKNASALPATPFNSHCCSCATLDCASESSSDCLIA